MAKIFSLDRIKSILEYNLRWARIKGFEYIDDTPGENPDGLSNLKPNDQITSWDNTKVPIEVPTRPSKYTLVDNNVNLRDAIAKTIFDILSGSDSDGSKTTSKDSIYDLSPAGGNNSNNGSGYYIEVDPSESIILKVGDTILTVSSTGVEIT